jgi:hypothetical protein
MDINTITTEIRASHRFDMEKLLQYLRQNMPNHFDASATATSVIIRQFKV